MSHPALVGSQTIAATLWRLTLIVAGLLVASLQSGHTETLQARDFKVAGTAERVRMVVNFDSEPKLRWFVARSPHRLVIELPPTRFAFDPADLQARGLIRAVQYGQAGQDHARLILSTKGPFEIERAEVIRAEDGTGYRFAVDLVAASDRAFEAALADQSVTTGAVSPDAGKASAASAAKPFTVVLDAGHGGVDGGANGVTGAVEKDVTLAFAQELRAALLASAPVKVVMTRDSDVFLRLDERVAIARQADADLFISIHADTIGVKGLRGATVYTVSDKASDAESKALADRENLADKLSGVDSGAENHEVADILVDLIRRETHAFSIRFARTLVDQLSTNVGLIKQPHRYAGFRVLKAPDVPSVLVELGYLSNVSDEAQLKSPEWRAMAAKCIAQAVMAFNADRGSRS